MLSRSHAVPSPEYRFYLFDMKGTQRLEKRGLVGIPPDLFWRQEPGVDLSVRSEADWQHGLRLYAAYNRDAGVKILWKQSALLLSWEIRPERMPCRGTALEH
jgi:hypothetical protein